MHHCLIMCIGCLCTQLFHSSTLYIIWPIDQYTVQYTWPCQLNYSVSACYVLWKLLNFTWPCTRHLLKATVILVPLLGFTWIIGLFAVGEEGRVFAYLFVIANVLQVRKTALTWLDCISSLRSIIMVIVLLFTLLLCSNWHRGHSYFCFMLQDMRRCGGRLRLNSLSWRYVA